MFVIYFLCKKHGEIKYTAMEMVAAVENFHLMIEMTDVLKKIHKKKAYPRFMLALSNGIEAGMASEDTTTSNYAREIRKIQLDKWKSLPSTFFNASRTYDLEQKCEVGIQFFKKMLEFAKSL